MGEVVWWCAINARGGHATYGEFKARKVVAQGWPAFGDLSAVVGLSRPQIEEVLADAKERLPTSIANWYQQKYLGRLFEYLLTQIAPGDLILAVEGRAVRGICEILPATKYLYDRTENIEAISSDCASPIFRAEAAFNYANCLYPVYWVDWERIDAQWAPKAPSLGIPGIARLGKEPANQVRARWRHFKETISPTLPWTGVWLEDRGRRRNAFIGSASVPPSSGFSDLSEAALAKRGSSP